MTIYLPELQEHTGPKYRAIADAIGQDIASGRLPPRSRLPAQRDLAWRLGVTVGTISRAYAEAARRGLLEGTVGRGTFVRAAAATPAERLTPGTGGLVELTQNAPPQGPHAGALSATLHDIAAGRDGPDLLGYMPEVGPPRHRQAGAEWLRRIGLQADPEGMMLCGGAQQGLSLALSAFSGPGDGILLEDLSYPQLIDAVHFAGRRPLSVAMDDQGIRPEALGAACRASGARLLFVVPTLQNPTNAVMSPARRQALVEVARRHDLLIVEDDVYGFLIEDRPPPIASLAPERTIYLASVSKCLAPGLRVAWLAAPEAQLGRLADAMRILQVALPALMGEIVGRWIEDGTAEQLLDWQRAEIAARHAIAREAFEGLEMRDHPASLHLLLSLPKPWTGDDFTAAARQRGIIILPLAPFLATADDDGAKSHGEAVRLSLGQAVSRAALAEALASLREILRRGPSRPRAII
ncbi:MAG: PLP-dependent aminotransferase family protein [Alphaproteobacteria bacterium]|nr:PLP-dependent aminotransferase family protein [Alphaproteobacteria bacterium]